MIFAWTIIGRGLIPESQGFLLSLLDGANLIFHEAGHILFLPFGEFLHYLGGSLTQVAIPALCAVHFRRQAQNASALIAVFWTGQSLTNVAIYVADVVRMEVPLIGGDHDWNYLLARIGLLNQAQAFGRMIFVCGVVVILFSTIGWGRELFQRWRGTNV